MELTQCQLGSSLQLGFMSYFSIMCAQGETVFKVGDIVHLSAPYNTLHDLELVFERN